MNDEELKEILDSAQVIASVGQSDNPARPSFGVMSYLMANGFVVVPVNPNAESVHGQRAYPDLASVPGKVDIVQVFRAPEHVPGVVQEAIAKGAKVVWMQDGAGNEEAAEMARAAGLKVVVDDCIMRVHARTKGL